MPCPDPHLIKYILQSPVIETQKWPPPSSFLPGITPPPPQVSEEISWPMHMYTFATPPFWALIYLFSFNLPVSGFPRPLIRPTQKLNTHTHTSTARGANLFLTPVLTRAFCTYMHTHIKVAQSLSALGGPLHTLAPSAVGVSQTGQRKGREEGKKKKKVKYSVLVCIEGGAGSEGIHLWTFSPPFQIYLSS